MKLLFIEPYAKLIPHFGTSLELIKSFISLQKEDITIKFLFCDAELLCCDINLENKKLYCLQCTSIRKNGLNILNERIETGNITNLRKTDSEKLQQIKQNFATLDELKAYHIDNFDIGYGAASSIISEIRNHKPNMIAHNSTINSLLLESYKVFISIQNHIEQYKPDKVYFFNGRMAILRAVMRACEAKNVPFFIHERGANIQKYMLYENVLPHNIAYNIHLINELWENEDKNDKFEIAKTFYEERANGINRQWISFTDKQNKTLLPVNWDSSKENIVIFNSSEDEFASIGKEWEWKIYPSQIEGISQIVKTFLSDKTKHFYLRIHPNLNTAHADILNEIYTLNFPNLTLIPPNSEVGSYMLLNSASKIITFGSTMGIEATYWGKPSIVLGKSFYYSLGSTYEPISHQDIILLLKETNLLPLPKEGALKYGYFINSFGYDFTYFKANDLFTGKFMNKNLEEQFPLNMIAKAYRRIAKFI